MNPLHPKNSIRVYLLFLLSGFFLFPSSVAQLSIEWDKTYGGTGWEELQTMALTADGGYIFGGITTTAAPSSEITQPSRDTVAWPEKEGDYWVIRTDGQGNPIWNRRYGGFKEDRLWSILQTADGGFILGGESASGIGADKTGASRGGMDFWVVKIDSLGNKEWDATYGGSANDTLRAIVPMPDGSFMLAGYSNSPAGFEKSEGARSELADYWVVKIAADGTYMKDFTFGGSGEERLFDATLLPDGNILLAGYSTSPISFDKQEPLYGLNDIWIVKITPTGQKIWEKTIGGSGEDVLQSVYLTNEGTILLLGQSGSPISGNKTEAQFGNLDAWIVNIQDAGTSAEILWQKTYGGLSNDYAYSAAQNHTGYYMVVGVTSSEPMPEGGRMTPILGYNDFWVLFLDEQGNLLWDETLGGADIDSGVAIKPAHDYSFIFGGHSSSSVSPPYKSEASRGLNDMWVVRTKCSFAGPDLEDLSRVCKDETLTVNATVTACPDCIYLWDDGAEEPVRHFRPDSSFQLKVTIVHPDGCDLSDSLTIQVSSGPESILAEGRPISCYGANNAEFHVAEVLGGEPPYLFSLNEGEWESSVHHIKMEPGDYTLQVLDANGCQLDTVFSIVQPEEVQVVLGDDIYLQLGDSVQLQALTNLTGSFSFEWGQPELSYCNCLTPWVSPDHTTTYSIVVKDENGCKADALVWVILDRTTAVFIPNAFSPNNDNVNDFFTIYGDSRLKQVKRLTVFDRWGKKMFDRSNFPPNVEQLGWDGSANDRKLDPAVFVYWVELEYADDRIELIKGSVTLMH